MRITEISIAGHLGLLQRGFGVLVQGIGVHAVIRINRHAHLGGDPERCVIELERMCQERLQRFLDEACHIADPFDVR